MQTARQFLRRTAALQTYRRRHPVLRRPILRTPSGSVNQTVRLGLKRRQQPRGPRRSRPRRHTPHFASGRPTLRAVVHHHRQHRRQAAFALHRAVAGELLQQHRRVLAYPLRHAAVHRGLELDQEQQPGPCTVRKPPLPEAHTPDHVAHAAEQPGIDGLPRHPLEGREVEVVRQVGGGQTQKVRHHLRQGVVELVGGVVVHGPTIGGAQRETNSPSARVVSDIRPSWRVRTEQGRCVCTRVHRQRWRSCPLLAPTTGRRCAPDLRADSTPATSG